MNDARPSPSWRGTERYLLVQYPNRQERQGQIRRYGDRWLLWSTRNWVRDGLAVDAPVFAGLRSEGIDDLYFYVPDEKAYYLATVADAERLGRIVTIGGRTQVLLARRYWRRVPALFSGWLASPRTQVLRLGEPADLEPPVRQPDLFGGKVS